MAENKKENLKALFTNTRTRIIIIFTFATLALGVAIGIYRMGWFQSVPSQASANLSTAPQGIRSVPGTANPTSQYAKLQEEQNVRQADLAMKKGGSAIPTIISTQSLNQGAEAIRTPGSVGFAELTRSAMENARGPWYEKLKSASCDKASVEEASKAGAGLDDFRQACSCQQLSQIGYSLKSLLPYCACPDLRAMGVNAKELKALGYDARRLRLCGFSACQLREAGFNAQALKDAGFSDDELKGAGYGDEAIRRAGGLPDDVTEEAVRQAGCDIDELKQLKAKGVSAAAIRRISGCDAAALTAAGFTPKELRDAGVGAAELLKAGLTPEALKKAGYSAADLLHAGVSPEALKAAGYSADELKKGALSLPDGITPEDIKKLGCSEDALTNARQAGVSANAVRKYSGCSAAQLKAAGYSDDALDAAGFTPEQIKAANEAVKARNQAIKQAGCDSDKLKTLLGQGVSAKHIHELNGCSAAQLKAAGATPQELLDAGFTPKDLLKAGFTPEQLKAAGVSDDALAGAGLTPDEIRAANEAVKARNQAIKQAGCDPDKLEALLRQGVSAKHIHKLNGCSAAQLKAAGATPQNLLDAGFTPKDLLKAGFTPEELKAAGVSDDALAGAGLTPDEIKAANEALKKRQQLIRSAGCEQEKLKELASKGITTREVRELNGCSDEQLKAAGFPPETTRERPDSIEKIAALAHLKDCSPEALKAAYKAGISAKAIREKQGCDAAALKSAGYGAKELKDAGYTAAELKGAGFSPKELKDAGFSAKALKDAGFGAKDLKDAGFSANALKGAGFNAKDLKDAGFSAKALKDAGFGAKDLKDAGFSANALKGAGFGAKDLKAAGFTAKELKDAGFSPKELHDAGFHANALREAGFSKEALLSAGIPIPNSAVTGLDTPAQSDFDMPRRSNSQSVAAAKQAASRLEQIALRQKEEMTAQRHRQEIQEKSSAMMGAATSAIQGWKTAPTQSYVAGSNKEEDGNNAVQMRSSSIPGTAQNQAAEGSQDDAGSIIVRTGDILFAVLDTSVNTDEPSPILATIVSGRLKGSKLIGSFTLPPNADKMVIMFNTISIPGASRTNSISAYAIDPETARTALSGRVDHHYLSRYGSMFAASFMEGIGNAFQSANTTVSIGGTGGGDNITVQNGINRSALENAIIGLATVGKSWGQVAQQNVNRPTTIELASGTGLGILFTQDVKFGKNEM